MKYFILLLLLSSCGPTFYLKRAERDLKKAEQLGAKVKSDTVWKEKIVYVPEYKTDTLIKRVDFRDTITLETTKVLTKVKVNTVTKEVYIESKCKSDTVKIRVPFTVTKEIKSGHSTWDLIILSIVVLLVGAVLGRIFWK
jgi:hypothetical protein